MTIHPVPERDGASPCAPTLSPAIDARASNLRSLASEPTVPYSPRQLSRREMMRLDVYGYHSPKLRRVVMVVRPATLATALELEFDPDIDQFAERPRQLKLPNEQGFELSFWTRNRRGLERFLLLTCTSSSRAAERERTAVVTAANQAQIPVRLITETTYLRQAVANANRLRMLPWIQCARDLPHASVLTDRVRELFALQPRHSFHRLEQSVSGFERCDVRAATCALIHAGELKVDWTSALHHHSLVEIGGAS